MTTTKVYQNNGSEDVFIPGVGDIAAGQVVSVTSEFHQPVVLSNFPGVVDISQDEISAGVDTPPVVDAPVAPVVESGVTNG